MDDLQWDAPEEVRKLTQAFEANPALMDTLVSLLKEEKDAFEQFMIDNPGRTRELLRLFDDNPILTDVLSWSISKLMQKDISGYGRDREMGLVPQHNGLFNVGNTCYINSAMQYLYAVEEFRRAVMDSLSMHSLIRALKEIFGSFGLSQMISANRLKYLWENMVFPPMNALISNPSGKFIIGIGGQMDAHEFIMGCFDILDGDKGRIGADDQVTKCFRFNVLETVHEKSNPSNYRNQEGSSIDLGLHIQAEPVGKEIPGEFMQALRSFGAPEELTGDNQYDVNGRKVDAVRYSRIENPPPVLLIQIRRFTSYYNASGDFVARKIDRPMAIPIDFYLPPEIMAVSRPVKYRLTSAIVHRGNPAGGHYWAQVRTRNGFEKCDDGKVESVNTEEALEEIRMGGYILAFTLDVPPKGILEECTEVSP
jgi:ubiquitin carboxyl-terminal hydrolase 7